jgi:teichuronic acid exporter
VSNSSENLRSTTINSVLWNAVGKFSAYGIEFIVGIALARVILPAEFGLISLTMIVISISQVFINSGISQAIVRKQDCTEIDFSTAFYFNLVLGVLFFLVIVLFAGPLSRFFESPELELIYKVLGLALIISAFTIIQQAILIKQLNFQLQSKITIISAIISGVLALIAAFSGWGVWSLVLKTLAGQLCTSILLWYWNRWRPILIFSYRSFKELFSFGSKLMVSGLIGTVYNNVSYAFIGRHFTPTDLGFFTRSEAFKNLFSQNIESIITGVGYPVLATLQEKREKLSDAFRQMFIVTFYIIMFVMLGVFLVANNMIFVLLGSVWIPSIFYLQLFCFIGILYPLLSMNINLMNVIGRSDIYLKLQTISQLGIIPVMIGGLYFGIEGFMYGSVLLSFFTYFLFAIETGKHILYGLIQQTRDMKRPILAFGLVILCFYAGKEVAGLEMGLVGLFFESALYFILVVGFSEIFRLESYGFLKRELKKYFRKN